MSYPGISYSDLRSHFAKDARNFAMDIDLLLKHSASRCIGLYEIEKTVELRLTTRDILHQRTSSTQTQDLNGTNN